MPTLLIPILLPVMLLAACGSDLSNAIFAEDADFLAALPTGDTLSLSYPVPGTGMADDDQLAELYTLTVSTVSIGGQVLELATTATSQILSIPPAERGEDYRVWGPVPYDPEPDYFLRVEMTRSSTGATYTYSFQIGATSVGPWWEFLQGSHNVGEDSVALGDGHIQYQDLQTDAVIQISYDLRGKPMIAADISNLDLGNGPVDQSWTWTETEDGGASLVLVQPAQSTSHLTALAKQDMSMDSRWDAQGAGRSDVITTGGALGIANWELHQCWGSDGGTTWSMDNLGWLEQAGSSQDCVVE